MITWMYGRQGEIIMFLFGKFHCTCDDWREFEEEKNKLLTI